MRISDWSSDVCSSDLGGAGRPQSRHGATRSPEPPGVVGCRAGAALSPGARRAHAVEGRHRGRCRGRRSPTRHSYRLRSEEHTSELQSLMRITYAVFCLKKKTDTLKIQTIAQHYNNPL